MNRLARRCCEDVTEAVGDVPTARLRRLAGVCQRVGCYLKLESCNPGGSIKEKNAAVLVAQAEAEGLLGPGGTIIESSSGNFGVGLAMVGAARGYRVVIVVDAKTTLTFRRMLEAYGAELVEVDEVDASGSMQKARIARATQLAQSIPGGWYPCQHYNPHNADAHFMMTAREIEVTFGSSLDALVVGVSTGGQLSGLARYLKPRYPDLKLVGVDVQGSVIFDPEPAPYKMTGIGLSFRPPNLDYASIHSAYVVPENLAYSMCHALARREGLLLGSSTGAIVAAGLHLAGTLPPKSQVLMINPDRGDRYLETIYAADWLESNGFVLIPDEHIDVAVEQLQCCIL
jgi:cysteine synthase A